MPRSTVCRAAGGGATSTVSDTEPPNPQPGDLWWDSTEGQLYIYYDDGTTSQWVVAINQDAIRGPQGPPGAASTVPGPPGPPGPAGDVAFVQDTPPVANEIGDLWYDTANGTINVWDGTNWVETEGLSAPGPVPIAFVSPGQRAQTQNANAAIVIPLTIPAGLAGSFGVCGCGPSTTVVCVLTHYTLVGSNWSGTPVGTVTFTPGNLTATPAGAGATLNPGDMFQLQIPADPALLDLGVTILATRS